MGVFSRSVLVAVGAAVGLLAFLPRESAAQKRQRDRITREEIMESAQKDADLFLLIRSTRPKFLEPPPGVRTLGGSMGLAPVQVYVDGKRDSGLDALKTILASTVQEIRYLDPTRSEGEFGPSANGGAIVIKLYKGPKPPTAPPPDTTRPPIR